MRKTVQTLTTLALVLACTSVAHAAGALRVSCDGEAEGAIVRLDGKVLGDCPLDAKIAEGTHELRVTKPSGQFKEQVFVKSITLGDGVVKRVDVVLGAPEFTPQGRKLEDDRLRRKQAEAAQALSKAGLNHGQVVKDCDVCPEMVVLGGGNFDMGSNTGDVDEKAVHAVHIDPFYIGKYEVTQAQYEAIMGSNPSHFENCGGNCPVENVGWNDAQKFIQALNQKTGKTYRLPSEAEWEYACRAGGQHTYCGSESVDSVGWYGINSGSTTHTVGGKQPNAWGLHDMSGNVWEWVQDVKHGNYNGAPNDGTAWEGDGDRRVLRGGSWDDYATYLRSAVRNFITPVFRYDNIGFRLARTVP